MGAQVGVTFRVVFDTAVVVSALLFQKAQLAWLRRHWAERSCMPLVSRATVDELLRVLTYPKFGLRPEDRRELLGEYLVYCKTVSRIERCPVACGDCADQPFLGLAHRGNADVLVTGDRALLELATRTGFVIESPADYRLRCEGHAH